MTRYHQTTFLDRLLDGTIDFLTSILILLLAPFIFWAVFTLVGAFD